MYRPEVHRGKSPGSPACLYSCTHAASKRKSVFHSHVKSKPLKVKYYILATEELRQISDNNRGDRNLRFFRQFGYSFDESCRIQFQHS